MAEHIGPVCDWNVTCNCSKVQLFTGWYAETCAGLKFGSEGLGAWTNPESTHGLPRAKPCMKAALVRGYGGAHSWMKFPNGSHYHFEYSHPDVSGGLDYRVEDTGEYVSLPS